MKTVLLAHFLNELGRNSLQAAVLVMTVMLAQGISGRRLSPYWRSALWLVVVVRLLVPFSAGGGMGVFNFGPQAEHWVAALRPPPKTEEAPLQVQPEPVSIPLPATSYQRVSNPGTAPHITGLPMNLPLEQQQPAPDVVIQYPPLNHPAPQVVIPRTRERVIAVPEAPTPVHSGGRVSGFLHFRPVLPSWPVILFWVWLAGVAALLGHLVISSLLLARRCARMQPLTHPATLALFEECCQRMGISGPVVVVESLEVSSPALHGLLHPRLLLPKGFTDSFSREELRFVFLHELAHLKRLDLWMNWVMVVLQSVHWFNPFVWFGFARWRDDREPACDAMVLEAMGPEHNQEYGRTILRLLENFTHPMSSPGLVGILEDKRQMRQRIAMIATYSPSPRCSLLAVLLIAFLTTVGLADVRSAASASSPAATPAATPEPVSQLTIELRDGSHLVAKGRDEILPFHSTALGDLKLAVTGLRSIEFKGESDTARVTATNGDVLDVQFAATNLHVETDFGKSELPVKLIRSLKISTIFPTVPPGPTYPAETTSQLTIDLQDGSRVLGKSLDETLGFHSSSLGNFKLAVTGLRSIVMDTAGMAHLTAANGDVLDVQLTTPALHVETAFGKSELAAKMIRSVKFSSTDSTTQLSSGLVGLWSGNDNGDDSAGTNNAIVPPGITYAPAKVGDGFQFNGHVSAVSVPASPSLDVGKGEGLTLSCWIAPDSVATQLPLMEWCGDPQARNWAIDWGVHFWISVFNQGVGGPGCIYANIVDTEGNYHFFASPPGIIQPNILQHTAVTYDKESGTGNIYYNGTLVATKYLGIFTPKTDTSLLFGARLGREETHFQGILNDLAVYNKALSAEEIAGIYNKQNTELVKPNNKTELSNVSDGQLTLELRDGSRVVGKSLDDPLKFHSASLGDFKLPVAGIRSLEFGTDSNSMTAHLTATNGDVLDVQFAAPTLHVESSFGKSEVPVKMIRTIHCSGKSIDAEGTPRFFYDAKTDFSPTKNPAGAWT